MAEQDPLSDDISALWGASDSEIPRPAPLEPLSASVDRQNGRLDALEGDVQRINRSIRSLRAADHDVLRAELGRRQEEAMSAVRADQARIEERLSQRVAELAERVAELAARAGVVTEQVYGLEDRTTGQQATGQDAPTPTPAPTSTPAPTPTPTSSPSDVESRLAAVEARLEVGLDSLGRQMHELAGHGGGPPVGSADEATTGGFEANEARYADAGAPEEVDAPVG